MINSRQHHFESLTGAAPIGKEAWFTSAQVAALLHPLDQGTAAAS